MFKKVLAAAAILLVCPAFVFAQDISFLFGGGLPEAGEGTATTTFSAAPGSPGSVFIYSRSGFDFDLADLRFSSSDSSVVRITGGEAFNPIFNVVGEERHDSSIIGTQANGGSLAIRSINGWGIDQALGELFDPLFDPSVGPDGSFLLARVDFVVVGKGTSEFSLREVSDGVRSRLGVRVFPIFGRATFSNADLPSTEDIYFLFGGSLPEAGGGTATSTLTGVIGTSGSVNIYSRSGFDFDAADLNFFCSDTSVAQITGGEAFNPTFDVIGGFRFNSSVITTTSDGAGGDLFSVSITTNGVNQALGELFDPLFDPSVGPDGAFLIARVDFEIVGVGDAEFSLSLGELGVVTVSTNVLLFPEFVNATLSGVPVPIILGDVNRDEVVSFLDVSPFIDVLITNSFDEQADCNEDGVVDFLDITAFIAILFST